MSAESSRAVFLSYASQDADAARRIAEALRAAGTEAWFDQDELRGGDAWDRKIKNQIRTCALFVPVISANTQARPEGYFRLEWHLAEQRSLLIAKGRAFIVPVCVDDTRDSEALVPDAFLAVQWSRPTTDTKLAQFVAQVQRLLAQPQSASRRTFPTEGTAKSVTPEAPAIPDFELLRQIGRGSYGDVWLARGASGLWRAIKIVWRERFADAEPFEREWRGLKEFAAISLGESSQLALLHLGRNDDAGFFYYVMELADDAERGRAIDPETYVPLTFAQLRAQRHRLPADECVRHGVELARVLAKLHARGLVHRDIKPSNVIVVNGAPKLADIGLVAPAANAQTFVGTEGFVPPEGPGTPAADVYALGKVLYELATGRDRLEFPQLPDNPGRLPDQRALLALNAVIQRACAPSPEKRYRDATTLLADLETLQAGRRVRHFPRWSLAAAAAVVVLGGGAFFLARKAPAPAAPATAVVAVPPPPAAPAISDKAIAVLPFANLSGDKAQEYVSDGITQEILGALRRERDLTVPGDTSCFAFKGKNATAAEIARALNVARLVEGSMRKDGNQVRINVTLTRAIDGFSEELGTFTEELSNLFALQEKLARAVVAKLTRREPAAVSFVAGTRNPEAYDLYLRARSIQTGGLTPSAGVELVQTFEKVVALDPNYALAWARLSQAYSRMRAGNRDRSAKNATDARNAAAAALRLAPDLPEAHLAMARIHLTYESDLDATERELDEVDRLGPNDAEAIALRASVAHARGRRGEEMVQLIARSVERDPQNSDTLVHLAGMLGSIGRFADADRLYERARSIADIGIYRRPQAMNWVKWTGDAVAAGKFLDETPDGSFDTVLLGLDRAKMRVMTGDFAGAIADYEKLRPIEAARGNVVIPDRQFDELVARAEARLGRPERLKDFWATSLAALQARAKDATISEGLAGGLAFAHAMLGDKAAARTWMAKWLDTPTRNQTRRQLEKAELLTLLGDKSAAIAELRALHENDYPFGYLLRLELDWEPLRGEPTFQQLMKDAEARANAQPRPRTTLGSNSKKPPAANPPASAAPTPAPSAPAENSLVVLPLETIGSDPDLGTLADGLHEDIIAALSRLADLKVRSRTTSLAFKGTTQSLAEIGRRTQATYALAGSVRKTGASLRIQLQLRRTQDEGVVWQNTFSFESDAGLAVQERIATEVANILQARATKGSWAGAQFMTTNAEAYRLFAQARVLHGVQRPGLATFEEQIRLCEEALKLDPKFMSAANLLSISYSYAHGSTREAPDKRARYAAEAKRWAEISAKLVPGGAGDGPLAVYYSRIENDPVRAHSYAQSELRALPNDANSHNRVATGLMRFGRAHEALAGYERALALDPINYRTLHNWVVCLAHLRRLPEFKVAEARTLAAYGTALSSDNYARHAYRLTGQYPPLRDNAPVATRILRAYAERHFADAVALIDAQLANASLAPDARFNFLLQRASATAATRRSDPAETRSDEALRLLEQLKPLPEEDQSIYQARRMWACALAGREEEAVSIGRHLVDSVRPAELLADRWGREEEFAELLAQLGRAPECTALLETLVKVPSLVTVPYLRASPRWDRVRDHPAFQALLADPRNSAPL